MSMTSENPEVTLDGSVTITGILSGLPPCESITTIVQVSGGGLLAGTPMPLPGSTLPANYRWADRSVVLFADWPDLKAVYDAGLLDVLPAEATDADKAANPGKWVLNGCGTGLFLPDIGGRFARDWRPGQTEDAGRGAGTRQGDAIRNISGECNPFKAAGLIGKKIGFTDGVFGPGQHYASRATHSTAEEGYALKFDASRVVPTAEENRPLNYARPIAIYMGRRAQDIQ